MSLRRWWDTFYASWVAAYRHNAFGIAKGAAYSGLLAFFPVLTTVVTILVQANAEKVAITITDFLFEVVPPGTHDVIRNNLLQGGYRPIFLLIFSSFLTLLAASGLMMSLMEGFRGAYGIQNGRPFWAQRRVAALLVVTAALPVVIASALIVLGGRAETWILTWIGVLPRGEQLRGALGVVSWVVRYAIALAAIMLSVASLYYFGPNHPDRRRRNVWPGAFQATWLYLLNTVVFAWYVTNLANYNLMYGSIAAVIALLVWMYLLSIVALVGCEYNAVRERQAVAGLL